MTQSNINVPTTEDLISSRLQGFIGAVDVLWLVFHHYKDLIIDRTDVKSVEQSYIHQLRMIEKYRISPKQLKIGLSAGYLGERIKVLIVRARLLKIGVDFSLEDIYAMIVHLRKYYRNFEYIGEVSFHNPQGPLLNLTRSIIAVYYPECAKLHPDADHKEIQKIVNEAMCIAHAYIYIIELRKETLPVLPLNALKHLPKVTVGD